jgi:hypothetical protein
MATLVNLVLFGGVLVFHTFLAAVLTRFFRIRMNTRAGSLLYAALIIPIVLVATTLVFSGVLGIGVDLGSSAIVLGVMIGMPLVLGFTIDMLYVPAPDEYELPDVQGDS